MPPINRTMSGPEWAMLLILSILWGGSFFFAEVAVKGLPPLLIVWARVAIAALTLWCVIAVVREKVPPLKPLIVPFAGMALLNNVTPFLLLVYGQTQIASGLAAILNATTPFFTVLAAHFLLDDEKATPRSIIGILIGFLGAILIIGPEALTGLTGSTVGMLACIGAAMSYGLAGVWGRRFRRLGVTPLVTAAGQVTGSTVILLPFVAIVSAPTLYLAQPPAILWSLIGLGTLSTALAYILFFRILQTAGATNIMLVTFLVPASAILLGVAFLNEVLLPRHLIGLGLIGVGLAAIDGRIVRLLNRRFRPAPGG